MDTQSDTVKFSTNKTKTAGTTATNISGGMSQPPAGFPDFDKIFGAPFFAAAKNAKPQVYTNPTTEIDWDNFASNFTGPPKFVPASQAVPTKYVKSQFNFHNSKIENAAIGNKGPVNFNKNTENYKAGATKSNFNISGGNFAQANIGGKADYSNKNTAVIAGGNAGAESPSSGFTSIKDDDRPFSPEQYLEKLLQTGVSSEDLIQLMEKKYSLVYLANALPVPKRKREFMIDSLLKMADMDKKCV